MIDLFGFDLANFFLKGFGNFLVSISISLVKLIILNLLVRYKYENNTVMDVSSPDASSPLNYQLYGNGKIGVDAPSRGTQNQLLERQVLFFSTSSFCVLIYLLGFV